MSLEELSANVLIASQNENLEDLLVLLQQMKEAAALPGDKNCLIGPVVKLLPLHNLGVKRQVYSILQKLCESHPDAALLAANYVLRDCRDPNPEVKCLAVWGISVLPPLLPLYAADVLVAALGDAHPRVRRTAVTSCGKVFGVAPGLLEEKGFVNRLYECIRDEDALVVVQALLVLDRALAQEGGVVVNRKLAQYLLLRLPHFQPPQLATVLQVLRKYTPKTDPELFAQLSLLDPYLAHKESAAVVVNCAQLFLQLVERGYPHLEKDVISRSLPSLTSFLGSNDTHAQGYVLDFLQWTESRKMDWLTPFHNSWSLFCPPRLSSSFKSATTVVGFTNHNVLLLKKLLLLPRVCSADNAVEVLHNLEESAWSCSDTTVCRAHLDCIVSLVERLPPPASSQALRLLTRFIESRNSVIIENALQSLEHLDVTKLLAEDVSPLLIAVVTSLNIVTEASIKETSVPSHFPAILLELLSERREAISLKTIIFIVQALVIHLPRIIESHHYNFASQILSTTMSLFLQEPASFQHILGRALHNCLNYNPDIATDPGHHVAVCNLQSQSSWYYRLLKADPTAALAKRAFIKSL